MLDKETWKIGTDHGKMEKLIKQHMHFFLNMDSLHGRLKSDYEAWRYKKKKHKKIKAYRKSPQKEPVNSRPKAI